MKNLVGKWYSNNDPLWWLSFGEPNGEKPFWWKFWRHAKEGEFLGVVIVQAPDIHEAVQVAWRKKINPGGEVCGLPILNADINDLNRLIVSCKGPTDRRQNEGVRRRKLQDARDAGARGSHRRKSIPPRRSSISPAQLPGGKRLLP